MIFSQFRGGFWGKFLNDRKKGSHQAPFCL
nr:MAG TPA: hypothetical protein [Caudoviricetes sp.]